MPAFRPSWIERFTRFLYKVLSGVDTFPMIPGMLSVQSLSLFLSYSKGKRAFDVEEEIQRGVFVVYVSCGGLYACASHGFKAKIRAFHVVLRTHTFSLTLTDSTLFIFGFRLSMIVKWLPFLVLLRCEREERRVRVFEIQPHCLSSSISE